MTRKKSKTFFYSVFGLLLSLQGNYAVAQSNIVPDTTLGTENSRVIPNAGGLPREEIQGGAQRGKNLFHSFREFNVGTGREAYFSNPTSVNNIFSRVTGNNSSEISGTLGVLGGANLFLINPNGIVFSTGARLDISGSFLASSANSFKFSDGQEFSAAGGQAPPLLHINTPKGLQWGDNPGEVLIVGADLAVGRKQSLVLAGGNIQSDNSTLTAPSGRVELTGLSKEGELNINNELSFEYPSKINYANVRLNTLVIDVSGEEKGNVLINANDLEITGSKIFAELNDKGKAEATAGDINLSASNISISGQGSSIVANSFGQGTAGNIFIDADIFTLSDEAFLGSSLVVEGDSGTITINANKSVILDRAFLTTQTFGEGDGGEIKIETGILELRNGSFIESGTNGIGDGGKIKILAKDSVLLEGEDNSLLEGEDNSREPTPSKISSQVTSVALGNGGEINIEADALTLKDGTSLSTSTNGKGDAGSITVNTEDFVLLEGLEQSKKDGPQILSEVESGATGQAGGIEINTKSLTLKNDALISSSTFGNGKAATVKLNATESLTINNLSEVFSIVGFGAKGDGGEIDIDTKSLDITDESSLRTSTNGEGNAGNISISADESVTIERGGMPINGIDSSVNFNGVGEGGDIEINTSKFILRENSLISVGTNGIGKGGIFKINAMDSVLIEGSQISSSTGFLIDSKPIAFAEAGDINIHTNSLKIGDRASLSADTSGSFNGGQIIIEANSLELTNGSKIESTTSNDGNAGTISLNVRDNIILEGRDTGIFANTTNIDTTGNGGNILVKPYDIDLLDTEKSRLSLNIPTTNLRIKDGANIAVSSSGSGLGGNIEIITNELTLDQGEILAETTSNLGGNIDINNQSLVLLRKNSLISATAGTDRGFGDGGNISIKSPIIFAVSQGNSDIIANAFRGNGGRIDISAEGIFGIAFREQQSLLTNDITASSDFGTDGVVEFNTPETDPESGLQNLPSQPAVARVERTCSPNRARLTNSLVNKGKGGLPQTPQDELSASSQETAWVGSKHSTAKTKATSDQETSKTQGSLPAPAPQNNPSFQLVEAEGWKISPDGSLQMTASSTSRQIQMNQNAAGC